MEKYIFLLKNRSYEHPVTMAMLRNLPPLQQKHNANGWQWDGAGVFWVTDTILLGTEITPADADVPLLGAKTKR